MLSAIGSVRPLWQLTTASASVNDDNTLIVGLFKLAPLQTARRAA
jgi:hypothetical protein